MKQTKKDLQANRRSGGFTMTELLAGVAILVILMSLATVGLVALRKQLRQRELDSKAEIIYVAAQNRLTELRAAGYDNVFTPGRQDGENGIYKMTQLPSDAKESEEGQENPDADRPTLYSVYSEDKETDGMAAKSMLPSTVVDVELWGNHWIIQYDPEGGSIYGVFYSEEENSITRDENTLNTLRYKQGRLADGAKVGYYGGDITRTNFTSELHPSIEIINAEKLIVKIRCNKAVSGMVTGPTALGFEIRLNDGAYVRTVTEGQMTQVSGTDYLYTWVLDSLLDGEHFYQQTGIPAGHTVKIEVKATVAGDDFVSGKETTPAYVNSLFADTPSDAADRDEHIAYIAYGRHLQNLDTATSHVASDITKAMMVRDFSFRDDKKDAEDYYSYYGPYFKPIENSNLKSFEGRYHSTSGQLQTVIDALHIPAVNPAGKSEYVSAGLFGSFSGDTLSNVYLSGLRIDGGGTVGGLVGRVSGSATLDNCRVYLDDREGDLSSVTQVENPEDVEAWLSGSTVGGLVGIVPSGASLTVQNSFASTALYARRYAGGLVGAAAGTLRVNTSYADCYLRSANYAAGILGGSTAGATVRLQDFYAVGFASADARLAGIAAGPVTSQTDGYTAVSHTRLEDDTELYSTCVSSGSSANVFYVPEEQDDTTVTPTPVDLPNTLAFSNDWLNSGRLLGKNMPEGQTAHLDDTVFVSGRQQNANPYNLLKDMTLSSYPYPALKGMEHFGDWKSFRDQETLVYYEVYEGGAYGVYGDLGTSLRSQSDKALGSRTAIRDGYAWAVRTLPSGQWRKTITFADGQTQELKVDGKNYVETKVNGETIYLFQLYGDQLNSQSQGDTFYQSLTVTDSDGKEETFYFNPYFAKTAIKADAAPATPQSISVRTARHLNALSRFYPQFMDITAKSTFQQELDVDYGTYLWAQTGATAPTAQAPIGDGQDGAQFQAIYNGGYHTVKNLNIQSDTYYMGLFGSIGPSGRVRNLFLIGTGTKQTNSVSFGGKSGQYFTGESARPYIGVLAGVNEGEIDNCAITGYRLEAYGYRNATLTIGGLVGLNRGHITDSSADIREIKFSNDHSTGKIGGFVGSNEGAISTSYSAGEINVRYATNATVTIAGFAAENSSSLYSCYAGVALLASGDAKAYGFAPTSSGISGCLYLDGGTFNYADSLRSMNTSTNIDSANAGGTPITGADLSVKRLAGFGSAYSQAQTLFHPETEAVKYPYPAVTHLSDGTLVHIGNWAAAEKDLGTLGVFYWEYESGGSNAGYHFSLLGTNQGIPISDTTLCQAHDDGGVVTRFGYGYFYAADGEIPTASFGSDTHKGAIHEDVGEALAAQLPQYLFVAYETGPHTGSSESYMHLSGSSVNGTWKLNYKDTAEYTYSVCPFFANAMSLDSYRTREDGLPNGTWSSQKQTGKVKPGHKEGEDELDNSYEIRSVAQLQFINWNYGSLSTTHSITAQNGRYNSQFPYLIWGNNNNPTGNKRLDAYWKQTHDIDAYAEGITLYTPIGSMYDAAGGLEYAQAEMAFFSSSYDGKSYIIRNIEISSSAQCIGVFGITAGAKLENIVLYSDQESKIEANASGNSWYCLGGLVGLAGSRDMDTSTFENCTVSGYKILDNHAKDPGWGGGCVGGLVGATTMDIVNCSAVTDITIHIGYTGAYQNERVGGIVGSCRGTLTNCYAGGSIQNTSEIPHKTYTERSSIWVGGLVGGIVLRNKGNLSSLIGDTGKVTTVNNCYSYVEMPKAGTHGLKSSQAIASNGEMQEWFASVENDYVVINNSYCLESAVTNTDRYDAVRGLSSFNSINLNGTHYSAGKGQTKYIYGSGNVDYWDRRIELNNAHSPYLTFEEMENGTLLGYLKEGQAAGSKGYGKVTTQEQGNPIDGKYSFPGKDTELKNLNYPFPTILTQTDVYGNTVNVHYGRWPKFGIYWDQNIDTMDILKDWTAGAVGIAAIDTAAAVPVEIPAEQPMDTEEAPETPQDAADSGTDPTQDPAVSADTAATPETASPGGTEQPSEPEAQTAQEQQPVTQPMPQEDAPAVSVTAEAGGEDVPEDAGTDEAPQPDAEDKNDAPSAESVPEQKAAPAVQAVTGAARKDRFLNVYSLNSFNSGAETPSFTYETDSGTAVDEKKAAAVVVNTTPTAGGYQVTLEAKRPGTLVIVAKLRGYTARLTVTVTADLQLEVGQSVVSLYEEDTVDVSVKLADGLHLDQPEALTLTTSVVSRDPDKPSAIADIVTDKSGNMTLRITGKNSGSATVTVKAAYKPSWAESPIEATRNVSVNTLPSMTLGVSDGIDFTGVSVLHTPNDQKHTGEPQETGPLAELEENEDLYLYLTCDENAAQDYIDLEKLEMKTVSLDIDGVSYALTQNEDEPDRYEDEGKNYSLTLGEIKNVERTEDTEPFHYRTLQLLDKDDAQPRQQWTLKLTFGRQGSSEKELYELDFARANILTFYPGLSAENPGQPLKTIRVPQGQAPDVDQDTLDAALETAYNGLSGAETPETGEHWSWVLPETEAITGNMAVYRSAASNTYTIEFNGNFDGWDIEYAKQTMEMVYGEAKPAPESPYTLAGYSLLGWALDGKAEQPDYKVGEPLKNLTAVHRDTVTLYALWKANTGTLTLHTLVTGEDEKEIVYTESADYDQSKSGAVVTLPDCDAENPGFTFLGWAAKKDSTTQDYSAGDSYTMNVQDGSAAFALYAVWEKAPESDPDTEENETPDEPAEDDLDTAPGNSASAGDNAGDTKSGSAPEQENTSESENTAEPENTSEPENTPESEEPPEPESGSESDA